MLFSQTHGLIAGCTVRDGIHIQDLIDSHPQDLMYRRMKPAHGAPGEMFNAGVQLSLSLYDTFQKPFNKGPLRGRHLPAVIQCPFDKHIAEGLIFLMRKKGKQNDLSLVLQCPSFFFCICSPVPAGSPFTHLRRRPPFTSMSSLRSCSTEAAAEAT